MTPKEIEELKTENLTPDEHAQSVFFGTNALYLVAKESVIPVISSCIGRSNYEEAIAGTYYRMFAWMISLTKLSHPIHIQAVCGGTRTMFELLLDLKQLVASPSLADTFHDFTFVARYRYAKQLIDHHDRVHGFDATKYPQERAFVGDPTRTANYDTIRLARWGRDGRGNIVNPTHWENSDAFSRATAVGTKYADLYRDIYARLCWFTHAGPAGLSGLSEDGLRAAFAWAHYHCQDLFMEGTVETANVFHIFTGDQELRQKLDDARRVTSLAAIDKLLEKKAAKTP